MTWWVLCSNTICCAAMFWTSWLLARANRRHAEQMAAQRLRTYDWLEKAQHLELVNVRLRAELDAAGADGAGK